MADTTRGWRKRFAINLCNVLVLVFGNGCTLMASRMDRGRAAYFAGDLVAAKTELSKVAQSHSPQAKTAKLDLAIVHLAAGEHRAAQACLREARDWADTSKSAAIVTDVASMATDDRRRPYQPAGYEEVMIRSLLSLCSLATGDGDAESYAMQAQMRQSELAQQATQRGLQLTPETYQPLAIAPYIRGMLREATHHDYDDAVRAYQLVSDLQPCFAPAASDIERCGGGVHAAPQHGVLYVFACVGRGPVLESVDAPTTTAALQIATQVYSLAENHRTMLPNLASVEVPKVVVPYSPTAAISVDSSGVWLGATQQLVDIGQMATRQNEAEMSHTIARAVVRRVVKEVAVSQSTKAIGLNGLPAELLRFGTVTAWSAAEQADTRCWSLLTREIQVLRAELPVGKHRIGFSAVNHSGQTLGARVSRDVELVEGQNTYVTLLAPERELMISTTSTTR